MSILGSIFGKIFNRDKDGPDAPAASPPKTTTPTGSTPVGTPAQGKPVAPPVRLDDADVEVIVGKYAEAKGEPLNWKTSIVDLLKSLDIDSSLENRKELADELGYTGDKSDSAAMNIWLHREVMKKIKENGGKVPAGLAD